ncbi:hypothetical protein L208DRAFT_1375544 [Tricholoma matsutake]|nr:hypothetical protein L208DRAFT_1375544 [Tricholoma matsutake 945]
MLCLTSNSSYRLWDHGNAKREAKAKATVATKADAVAQLVEMEVDQELEEAARCQHVLQCQPSVFDVLADNSGEQFNWSEAEEDGSDSDKEKLTPTGHGGMAGSKQVKPNQDRVLPPASGLNEGLKEKVKLNHGLIQDDSMVSGLNDEDELSVQPQFEKRKQGPVNAVVTSISDSDDSRNESMPVHGSNPKKAVYKVPAECKPIAKMGKLKWPLCQKCQTASMQSNLPLPFHNLALVKQFHATCYHAWMASDDHFNGYSLESNHLLKIVHKAFKKTSPEIYNNLQTLRSNLACAGLGTVMTYLSEMSKQEVKEWVVWTCAACLGELVYKEPCLPGYSLVKGSLNFKCFSSVEAKRLTYDAIHDQFS